MGYISIAKIVESHIILKKFNKKGNVEERELVYYADKRVLHDKIVSIEVRIDDLIERYGKTIIIRRLIKKNIKYIYQIENKIRRNSIMDIENILLNL